MIFFLLFKVDELEEQVAIQSALIYNGFNQGRSKLKFCYGAERNLRPSKNNF